MVAAEAEAVLGGAPAAAPAAKGMTARASQRERDGGGRGGGRRTAAAPASSSQLRAARCAFRSRSTARRRGAALHARSSSRRPACVRSIRCRRIGDAAWRWIRCTRRAARWESGVWSSTSVMGCASSRSTLTFDAASDADCTKLLWPLHQAAERRCRRRRRAGGAAADGGVQFYRCRCRRRLPDVSVIQRFELCAPPFETRSLLADADRASNCGAPTRHGASFASLCAKSQRHHADTNVCEPQ